MEFTRPSPYSIFDIRNAYGIKLLTRLYVDLKHHWFKHGFNDTINAICNCERDIESISYFFIQCPEYCEVRQFDKTLIKY